MIALEGTGDDLWHGLGVGSADCLYRKCRNYAYENVRIGYCDKMMQTRFVYLAA